MASPLLKNPSSPIFQRGRFTRRIEGGPRNNQVVDLPIHCKIIRIRCNAIQTILQLNSNNYSSCEKAGYFAVAVFRGEWRRMAVFSGSYSVRIRRNSTLFVRN
jgi:hypothetical protein